MTARIVRFGAAALAAAALAFAWTPATAQTVTGSIRGRILSTAGTAVASATVTATNRETGVARSALTDAEGRYRLFGLAPGNYAVRAQAIGHRPLEKTGYRLLVGAELIVDFALEASAVELTAIPVEADQTPIVDVTETGVSHTVTEERIDNLPANGRNFTDFIALSPTFVQTPLFGAGGAIGSIGGSRNSGVVLTIDGANNTGGFFGGDARGSDRLPVAFSIEAVKEFETITNGYDVSRGGFTGGLVNAVTKTGTNELHGALFEYYRNEALTADDFLDNHPANFLSHQFGVSVGGPVIRDRLHFFFALDRQRRTEPLTAIAPNVTGVSATTLARLDSIIRNVYGVDPGATGTTTAEENEWALFGRLDFNISANHRIAIRDNFTALDLVNDRVSTGSSNTFDYTSNGGAQKPKANSFVVNLFSNFGPTVYNEFRFQSATDLKERPPGAPFPQVRVNLGGRFIAFGADSILHFNNLEERVLQFSDAMTITRGAHAIQLGTDNMRQKFFNLFFNNGRGTYTFNWGSDQATLDSMIALHASAFTRAVPVSGVSPVAFPDSMPVAEYTAWNYAFFLQDKWQATPRLTINAGIRLDVPKVSGAARNNPLLLDSFPQFFLDSAGIARLQGGTATAQDSLTTGREVPAAYNWQPRLGFAYDVWGDQRTVLRGGAGMFYGYTPFVYWSNMLLNTGQDQLNVVCAGTTPAAQNVDLTQDAPTNCGPLTPPAANAFFFTQRDPVTGAPKTFKTPVSFKTNVGIDHAITRDFAVGFEVTYAETYHNYSIRDVNYRSNVTAVLAGEGGRKIVGGAPGSSGSAVRRIDPRFIQILEHDNRSRGDYWAFIPRFKWRTPQVDFEGSFTWSRARDDISVSCCTSTTSYRLVQAGLNTNNELEGNFGLSDNDRTHSLVLSALWRAPAGFRVSTIWRTFSGLPYSAVISSSNDANGDGITGNDRAYIPRNRADIAIDGNGGTAGVGTAVQQDSAYAVLDRIIRDNDCLERQRGRITERNSCRTRGTSLLDIRVAKEIALISGHSLELQFDLFNVLNGINPRWGRVTSESGTLLRVRGFDAVNNRYVYEVQQFFGSKNIEGGQSLGQFQMQLGARYRF
jgi:hypothetical protein